MNKLISDEEFVALRKFYLQDVEELKKRIQVIDEELKLLKLKLNKKDGITNILKKYKKINVLNRVIVDELIDKIYIGKMNKETKERDIIIKWNI